VQQRDVRRDADGDHAAHVAIMTDELNRDPWLFNCPNGTIDLRTGKLREHRREDFLTTICPTIFNPEAGSLVWDSFLESTFADHGDVIAFMQRLIGSALVGMVRDHVLPIFYGCGANGKTVLLNAIIAALGIDYAMQAVPDMLMDSDGEKHPTERADLFGKRFVAAVETEQGRRLSDTVSTQIQPDDGSASSKRGIKLLSPELRKQFLEAASLVAKLQILAEQKLEQSRE